MVSNIGGNGVNRGEILFSVLVARTGLDILARKISTVNVLRIADIYSEFF
jgi:hypothetical protein